MGCYFLNTLLPKAHPAEVGEAVCRWHAQEGYVQQFGRRPFDCDSLYGDSVVYIFSNEHWCILVSSFDFEEHLAIRRALSEFPAMVQLWGRDGGWGYTLHERGALATSFCTKATIRQCDAIPGIPSDLKRLAAACGVPSAVPNLLQIERAHFSTAQKSCAGFAEALGAPLAALNFYGVEKANGGMAEDRTIKDWRMQVLSFNKPGQKPAPMFPHLASLTAEQREEIVQRARKTRRWLRPVARVMACLALFPMLVMILGGVLLYLFGRIPWIRRFTEGKETLSLDEFLEDIRKTEPKPIEINGDVARNTRHNCSITTPPPARTLPTFWARKPIPYDDPVFNVELNGYSLHCEGYSLSRLPKWAGITALEKREFIAGNCNAEFERWENRFKTRCWAHYQWTVKSPTAAYRFSCVTEKEVSPHDLKLMEDIVRSFKI